MNRFFPADHPSVVPIHEPLEHLVVLEKRPPTPGRSLETMTTEPLEPVRLPFRYLRLLGRRVK